MINEVTQNAWMVFLIRTGWQPAVASMVKFGWLLRHW
jgi:hypothetical protein